MPDSIERRFERLKVKADLCVTLARRMLGYTLPDQVVEDQAVDLMKLPLRTLKRLVSRLPKRRMKQDSSQKRITRRVARPWWERLIDD